MIRVARSTAFLPVKRKNVAFIFLKQTLGAFTNRLDTDGIKGRTKAITPERTNMVTRFLTVGADTPMDFTI